ncbi:MAG: hypothetical protein ACRBN8_35020 [Nannocystales bacterium]
MTGPDRDPSQDSKANLQANREATCEQIARELAALGEEPLDVSGQDDLALEFALADGKPRADIDVATVQTLAGWADPARESAQDDPLSELAQARVWRTIELRDKANAPDSQPGSTPESKPSPKPGARSDGARSARPVLFAVAALLAVAAAVVLVPVLTADTPALSEESPVARGATAPPAITAEELDVLSTQARAGLAALDRLSGEPSGTARVEAMASDYAGRLEALGSVPGTVTGPQGNQG